VSLIDFGLTEQEGVLLALVARAGPITAYQISKVYEDSPVSNYNSSKGKIYPMIRRLRVANLLSSEPVPGDGRGTEQLSITEDGIKAVREWILRISQPQLLPDDPLRTRLQSMDLLSLEERLQWVSDVREQLRAKLNSLEQYGNEVSTPFHDLVHDNAVRSIQSRMDWLDRVLAAMLRLEGRVQAG
jgi:DNA-binding PadR family transcriptional regulator